MLEAHTTGPPMRALALLLLVLAAGSAGAQTYTLTADVAYDRIAGVDPNLLSLDVYRPAGAGPFPIVVFVHGGGWHTGDKVSAVHDKADWLTAQGILFVSVNYRLSPTPVLDPDPARLRYPTYPEDVGRAVAFVQANAAAVGGDPGRVAVVGHSAGAHVAALVGLDPRYRAAAGAPAAPLPCVVSLSTNAYDIPAYLARAAPSDQVALYVNAFTADPAVQAEASPIAYAGRAPQTAVMVVHEDVPQQRLLVGRFLGALAGAGHATDAYEAAGFSHGDVNTRLGSPDEPAYNAAVGGFLAACFARSTGAAPAPEADGALGVWPNPTAGPVRLTLPPGDAPALVSVADGLGRTLLWAENTDTLDLSGLPPGLYAVSVRRGARAYRQRVAVVR